MIVKWLFYDPVEDEEYEFEINPAAGGSPQYKKNFTYQSVVDPLAAPVVMQGRSDPLTLEFSGTILSEDQYRTMVDWWYRNCVIQLTDVSPKRERAYHYPWKHSYTAKCTILGVPEE